MNRRQFLAATATLAAQPAKRPNILFAIADDQSWLHTSFAGDPIVRTPNFDRIARAFSGQPGNVAGRAQQVRKDGELLREKAGVGAGFFQLPDGAAC